MANINPRTLNHTRKTFAANNKLFKFVEQRVLKLYRKDDESNVKSTTNVTSTANRNVLYVMARDQRVEDNWAMLYAQKLAFDYSSKMFVTYNFDHQILKNSSQRHFYFILNGLLEVNDSLKELNIPFIFDDGSIVNNIKNIIANYKICHIVLDFSPLKEFKSVRTELVKLISGISTSNIAIDLVDAHNIIPTWVSSIKQEIGARTMRSKIFSKLDKYLTEYPPVIKNISDYSENLNIFTNSFQKITNALSDLDKSSIILDFIPGEKSGLAMANDFINDKLKYYKDKRNDPNSEMSSKLSPWLHFGQISPQRIALEILKQYGNKKTISDHSKLWKETPENSFLEELIVRRELSDNFCYYCLDYTKVDMASANWAKNTLKIHEKDKRIYLYDVGKFERAETHDELWNAAQKQMVKTGSMNGFLRMYWAKKILEWTNTPQEALDTANYLNDKYSLDGSDPNGYTGTAWSICGVHDQGWSEREIFGKIRYMNLSGCARKFNVNNFISKYDSNASQQPKLSKFIN